MGKSSLLVCGRQRLGSGRWGETAVIGYFTQYPPEMDEDLRLIDYIRWVGGRGLGDGVVREVWQVCAFSRFANLTNWAGWGEGFKWKL